MVRPVYERDGGNNGGMADSTKLTFVDAVVEGFRRWRMTDGTASRPAFWYWFLFSVILAPVASTIDALVLPPSTLVIPEQLDTITGVQIREILDVTLNESIWTLSTLVTVVLFIPTLTVTIRRFRDAGSSLALAAAVQLIGPLSTVALFWLGYSSADLLDAGVSEANAGSLMVLALSMLGLAAANVAGFIVWVVVAARPAKSAEPR
jgi:hypothetical protein